MERFRSLKIFLRRSRRICIVAALVAVFSLPSLCAAQQPNGGPDELIAPPEPQNQNQAPDQSQDQNQDQNPNQIAPASVPSLATRVTVRGQVRNALTGEPLLRALVRIEGDASTGALTDGQGRFEISGLPVGPQIFEVRKPSFYDRASTAMGIDQNNAAGSARNVLVAAEMPELFFYLTPASSIHGQIVLSTGDPAQGIDVVLLRRTIADGRPFWQTTSGARINSEGRYRFTGLTAGEYAIYTEPAMESNAATSLVEPGSGGAVARSGYASVFYPDARDLAAAARIQLAGGEQGQANFTLTLEPFQAVTAVAALPRGSSAAVEATANLTAAVLDAEGHRLPYAAQYDSATKTIQTALPDGSYSLLVSSQPQLTNSFHRGKVEGANFALSGLDRFSIAGNPVANLRIPLSAQPANQVQLTVIRSAIPSTGQNEPATPAASSQAGQVGQVGQAWRGSIEVMATETGEWVGGGNTPFYAQQMQPGSNPAAHLPPGSYWLRAFTGSSGFCERSFTAAGANLAREPLVVSLTGSAPPLELTLRDDCAQLTLSLPPTLMAIAPGEEPYYTVYVVPGFDSTSGVEPQTLRSSSGGVITLDNLTPGSYRVYTFAAPVSLEYRNPAVLAALPSQTVTLSAGDPSNLVLEVPERQ